ncbi:MAG: hemolysin family protein [Gemmatimonadota bacterium]
MTVLDLFAAFLLVLANALFVAAQFSLVEARGSRGRESAPEGARRARQVRAAQEDIGRTISGAQLGITFSSLGLGWIAESVIADRLVSGLGSLEEPWNAVATHGVAIAIALVLISFLHIVLGQLVPKSVALLRPDRVSRMLAGPLNLFNLLMRPLLWVSNGSADLVLRLFGLRLAEVEERAHSPEEIQLLLRHSRSKGTVEDGEEAMIQAVFELTNTVAREVMTPRPDIVAFQAKTSLDEVLKTVAKSGRSRFPVYGESIDDTLGVVLVKDLIRWMQKSQPVPFDLREVMRQAYFVPDTKAVDDLLAEMRHHKVHMAVVVDEFGGTDGIVTLEDLLEEIVGEIFDEHDVPESDVTIDEDGRILIDGGADFADVVAEFGLAIEEPEGDYDTVAGFVIGTLGRIPETGYRVPVGEGELEVLETNEKRVTRLELFVTAGSHDRKSQTEGEAVDDL